LVGVKQVVASVASRCLGFILLVGLLCRVERDRIDRLPVAGRAGPTVGAAGLGGLVDLRTAAQPLAILPLMALFRRNEPQGAMQVHAVVPGDEACGPGAGRLDGREGAAAR
jgi:hypothetical protein